MPIVTSIIVKPERHALIMPRNCKCGRCAPTWARRSRRSDHFSEPVTLLAALEQEDAAARIAMLEQHRICLTAMAAALRVIASEAHDVRGAPAIVLPVVLFAGELAAAISPGQVHGEIPDKVVRACEQTVTAATLAAAGCLVEAA